ncbi:hypothetical protein [Sphingobium sp. Ant17]|uniref:IS66 family transposase n=1 Tax=Sphingobium sp. Ant17 TaxID=1461752 RepID=UPI0004BCC29F
METLSARDMQDLREAVARADLRAVEAEANAARVLAINADLIARNAHLELQNEKMRRALHGPSSERSRRLIDQMELEFEELEATATEDEIAAQQALQKKTTTVEAFTRKRQNAPGVSARSSRRAGRYSRREELSLLRFG